jgi:hypothetical protein
MERIMNFLRAVFTVKGEYQNRAAEGHRIKTEVDKQVKEARDTAADALRSARRSAHSADRVSRLAQMAIEKLEESRRAQ